MLRYVIVAVGDIDDDPALEPTEGDLEFLGELIERTGVTVTILSKSASRSLTALLLREAIR